MSHESNPYFDYIAWCSANKYTDMGSPILDERYKNVVIVVENNTLTLYKLDPIAMKCFNFSYHGMICISEQWEYFKKCLNHVNEGLLEANKKLLGFTELAKIEIPQNHKGLIDPPELYTSRFKLVFNPEKDEITYTFDRNERLIDCFEYMIKKYEDNIYSANIELKTYV